MSELFESEPTTNVKNLTWADVANKISESRSTTSRLNPRAAPFCPRSAAATTTAATAPQNARAKPALPTDTHVVPVDSLRTSNGVILMNYHYVKCTNESSHELKKQRGVVYDTKSNQCVCRSFGYVTEIDAAKIDAAQETIAGLEPLSEYRKYALIEGFHIRVYQVSGVYYVSTHNKINAFESKWNSDASFGTLFLRALAARMRVQVLQNDAAQRCPTSMEEVNAPHSFSHPHNKIPRDPYLQKLCDKLNPQYVYDFLVSNDTDNRIVCEALKVPVVYLLGMFDSTKDFAYVPPPEDGIVGIFPPPQIAIDSIKVLINEVAHMDYMKCPGVALIHKTTGEIARVFHPHYLKCMRLRGETPNLELRYLEIRKNPENREQFMQIFSEYCERFEEIENLINEQMPQVIARVYDIRYNKNVYYHTDQIFHFILRNLHSIGLTRVTRDQILKELNALSPAALHKLIMSTSWQPIEVGE